MARLHSQYVGTNSYHSKLKLTKSRRKKLRKSRKAIRDKIRKYFKEKKSNELQPKFWMQGSYKHETTVNPIVEKDADDNELREYDLDDGIYFIEKKDEDNRKSIQTWHDWVHDAVKDHTGKTKKKTTCVRVIFSKGHHIDLPIYYSLSEDDTPELAHKSKGWLESDPREFTDWIEDNCNAQTKRIILYLKGWKNYRENQNSNLKLPSGFILTILAQENYYEDDNDDTAFRETIRAIEKTLDKKFECFRPTTPADEDLFEDYSETKKNDFLNNLKNILKACDDADNENNFKKASECMRKQFGDRFPLGKDEEETKKSNRLKSSIAGTGFVQKPYGGKRKAD
jgi:hypothetical protein